MAKPLSPAAQAVLDAAYTAWVTEDAPSPIAAAALRAAAAHMEFVQDSAKLHHIATELEGDRQGEQSPAGETTTTNHTT